MSSAGEGREGKRERQDERPQLPSVLCSPRERRWRVRLRKAPLANVDASGTPDGQVSKSPEHQTR